MYLHPRFLEKNLEGIKKQIEQIFDEGINELMINGEEGTELVDEFLKVNLEESRGKKLKEVVKFECDDNIDIILNELKNKEIVL